MARFNQYFGAAVASIGAFGLGTVMGWSSPAIPDMESTPLFETISSDEKSWIGSMAVLGALASCPITGVLIDRLGRKNSIIMFSLPLLLGWVLLSYSLTMSSIYVGRFVTGFCGGAFSLAVPVFISEISDDSIRGILSSGFQLFFTLGVLFTYIVGSFVHWKKLAMICSVFPLFLIILIVLFIPETPRFLVSAGQRANALKALEFYRADESEDQIKEEFAALEKSVNDKEENGITMSDLFSRKSMWPLSICLILMVIEQLSAFNAVIFYTVEIFNAAGLDKNSNLDTIIVGSVQVIGTFVSSLVVERLGRRILLLVSESIMALSLIVLASYFYIKDVETQISLDAFHFIPVLTLAIFILAYSIGLGPLTWTIMGEILPPHLKGIFSAIATSFVWLLAFLITKTYENIVEAVGLEYTFLAFGVCSIFGVLYIYFFIPETKGKSLEEIQLMFNKRSSSISTSIATIA